MAQAVMFYPQRDGNKADDEEANQEIDKVFATHGYTLKSTLRPVPSNTVESPTDVLYSLAIRR